MIKPFKHYLKETREIITKSWYHPDTKKEVIVDMRPRDMLSGGFDSHTNHAFMNSHLYGYDTPEHIFTKAGYSPQMANELIKKLKSHHEKEGGYVDWHDPLVHAMHKSGWVRVVKSNDYDSDQPHLYVGSHDSELNKRAALDLQKDNETKKVTLSSYKEKGLNSEDPFNPSSRAKYEDYTI